MADANQPKTLDSESPPRHEPTQGLYGWITHTELASGDPNATKTWCQEVLGWTFSPSFPMDAGDEYHLFAYSDQGGGGIRRNNPPEVPAAYRTSTCRMHRPPSKRPSRPAPRRCCRPAASWRA